MTTPFARLVGALALIKLQPERLDEIVTSALLFSRCMRGDGDGGTLPSMFFALMHRHMGAQQQGAVTTTLQELVEAFMIDNFLPSDLPPC
jgi:hypothetical protein